MKRLVVIAALLAWLLPVHALAADFVRVAADVKADLAKSRQEQATAKAEYAKQQAELERRVADVQARLAAERTRLETARKDLKETHALRVELSNRLVEEGGDLRELAGIVRSAARDLLVLAESSPTTAEQPARLEYLRTYLDKTRHPGLNEVAKLVDLYFAEMAATSQVIVRSGPLVNRSGKETSADIVRIGGFTTIYQAGDEIGFATVGKGTGRLLAVAGEPGWRMSGNMEDYIKGQSSQVYMDVSNGAALRQLSKQESLWEQIQAGGPLVWPILLVGLIALVLIIERLLFFRRVRSNTDVLMSLVTKLVATGDYEGALSAAETQADRPTSNVIKAGLALRGNSQEVVESGLSEAMLRELPRLERFLTVLKVLAAVAPLLGLLGTVTGMINTFHVITAFGTSDPRLMAGGISEALITTQFGLTVAIPIMVAAALLTRKAQRLTGDMEEKAVALSAVLISREA